MEDEPCESVNFVPCVKWVKRGVAKSNPEKVELSQKELEEIIKDTKSKIRFNEVEEDESGDSGNEEASTVADDEYDLEHYDDEDDTFNAGINQIVDVTKTEENNEDEVDSDAEDDLIKPSDNLILVGHVEGDASILEVYVYNEEEGSLYVHHDMLLSSLPLSIEWLNFDPEDVNTPGNLCAVGSMSPIIEVWDLDLINSVEPAFKLGRKGSTKKGIRRIGHSEAVLALKWNLNLNHVLASGSVDRTVLLWDLETKQPGTCLSSFEEKIQTLGWHPFEGQTLLTGSCDNKARVFDCRGDNTFKFWRTEGEVEAVLWNHLNPYNFFVSTSLGQVEYYDCRQDSCLWKLKAHEKEVTGLSISKQCPGLLVTAGHDGILKTWDVCESGPVFVSEKLLNIGNVHSLDMAPDSPFLICAGGDKKSNNFGVWHLLEQTLNEKRFLNRELIQARPASTNNESMDLEPVASSSSGPSTSQPRDTVRITSKKKTLEKKHKKRDGLPFKKFKKFKNM